VDSRIDWSVGRAATRDINSIISLTELHKGAEIPYTLDYRYVEFHLDQILVVRDDEEDKVGCFEHVIEAPFDIRDLVFLKSIKQFPYIDDVKPGELVNCCQSAGAGKGSHRAMYEYQKSHWSKIYTWISIKSPLWEVLKDLGWEVVQDFVFFNIWKNGTSTFRLGTWTR